MRYNSTIGRKIKKGAPECMRAINKHAEPIGWASVSNAFVISIYYSVLFAGVIMMCVFSFKFGFMTGADKTTQAGNLFNELTKTTYGVNGFSSISIPVLICLVVGLVLIYFCIRNGSDSIGKVISFIVPIPFICLVIIDVAIPNATLPINNAIVASATEEAFLFFKPFLHVVFLYIKNIYI